MLMHKHCGGELGIDPNYTTYDEGHREVAVGVHCKKCGEHITLVPKNTVEDVPLERRPN